MVRAIGYLPEADCYITASWDKSLRMWYRPVDPRLKAKEGAAGGAGEGGWRGGGDVRPT